MTLAAYNARTAAAWRLVPADLGVDAWGDEAGIRRWQTAYGLAADGWVGRRTAATVYAVRGARGCLDVEAMDPLRSWPRQDPPLPRMIVWHDTITRSAEATRRVLADRGLSTHFIVDEDGTIYECADPVSRWCAHAGRVNQESIGVDVVNLLDVSLLGSAAGDSHRRCRVVSRPWAPASDGRTCIEYPPAQKAAVVRLARALSDWLRIPYRVPPPCPGSRTHAWVTEAYSGHVSHSALSTQRWDGNLVAELLRADGAEEATA